MRYLILILLCNLSAGCVSAQKTEVLEARLREQQLQAARMAGKLERAQSDLIVAQQESNGLRQQLAADGKQPIHPEQANVLYRMANLRIDQLQSSILPVSHSDSGLINVVLTPVDQYNESLKLPGSITIELLAEQPDGEKLLDRHEFSASQVQKKWNAGWVSSGFVLQFPWPEKHSLADYSEQHLVLKATFITVDGRKFVARHQLKVGKQASFATDSIASSPEKTELEQTKFEQPSAEPGRIDTSDRRTIDEFPILR